VVSKGGVIMAVGFSAEEKGNSNAETWYSVIVRDFRRFYH
jgi:hypothetical protein